MRVDKEYLRENIAEILELDAEEVTDDANFIADLAMNSLQVLEVVAFIEDEYGIKIAQTDFKYFNTLNNIVEKIEKS